MAAEEADGVEHPVITRMSFNKYLQDNGVCFSARLTDAFLKRFCRLSTDLVLELDQFKAALLDLHASPPILVTEFEKTPGK